MRLAHHLLRHPSGVFHFRLVIPADLRGVFGLKILKKSLRTRDLAVARACAYALGARYAGAFAALRSQLVAKGPRLDEVLRTLHGGEERPYTLTLPNGVSITAESAEDHARALEAYKVVMALPLPVSPPVSTSMPGAMVALPVDPRLKPITCGKAAKDYLATLTGGTMPDKTRTQKRSAVNGFTTWKDDHKPLTEVTRTDVALWVQSLRQSGIATPTLANKCSYLKAFFAWAQASAYYPEGDNPATRHVKQSTREKRLRRKRGFRAFTVDQVQKIYAPEALATLNEPTRWGALLGLYTGARVTEVGQLALKDFSVTDGVWCMVITDDGHGQSLKNDVSARTIPIHPDLIALGLMDRVERLRAKGETQLFPRAKAGSVNGMGNWLSKSYGRHLADLGIAPDGPGKVGFHSLRKTAIEGMTRAGVRTEARAQYVGHDLSDEHHEAYGYTFRKDELLNGVGQGEHETAGIKTLGYALDLEAIREVLQTKPTRKTANRRLSLAP